MSKHVDFEKYQKFVDAVTSDQSTDFVALADRLVELDEKGANIERLLTAGVGINAEGGEFLEIIRVELRLVSSLLLSLLFLLGLGDLSLILSLSLFEEFLSLLR